MITITTKINSYPSYPIEKPFTRNEVVFFDIETTGFSAKTSYLYLIGCMYYKDDTWQMTQWLADDLLSEANLLNIFFQFIIPFKRIIHYNGSGFDIPFLLQKSKQHHLEAPFETLESFDLYKKVIPFKKLLPLSNYKLKTVESFLGFNRLDTYSGEDLIQVYANYLGRKQYEKLHKIARSNNTHSLDKEDSCYGHAVLVSAAELESALLLHNSEDIKGLLNIADILFFTDLFTADLNGLLSNMTEPSLEYKKEENLVNNSLTAICKIQLNLCFNNLKKLTYITPFPDTSILHNDKNQEISVDTCKEETDANYIMLEVEESQLTLQLPIYKGELKFFYDNYKDYYYLPKEDTVVHKSVGQYVDKEFKVKAKPATCYNKKIGEFLPQTDFIYSPYFKINYADKLSYFERREGFEHDVKFISYIQSILHYILQNKETKVTE